MLRRLLPSFLLPSPPPAKRVLVEQGELEESGLGLTSESGRPFLSFLGVPYAEAERFRRPRPAAKWDGVFRADRVVECLQPNDLGLLGAVTGQEDGCLVLNVYAPADRTADEETLPVLVWIHGGGFVSGSCSPGLYGPEYFMDQPGLVLVTLNYRLGPLGFLGMGDDVMPGNLGLWDQLMALK